MVNKIYMKSEYIILKGEKMTEPMIEFTFRAMLFLAIFLAGAYFLFRHIEKVKIKHGTPEDSDNYMAIIKHYFIPSGKD